MAILNLRNVTSFSALALFSALSWAEPTVYGKANVSFQNADNGSDSITELVSNASRLGIKGSEELDNGVTAIYQLEFEVDIADGDRSGSPFSQRNIFVGLKGDFGTVKMGKFDTPLKSAQKKIDLFGDLVGDIKNLTPNENRASNIVSYSTPKGPFAFTGALVSSEDTDADDGFSTSISFSTDSLYVAAAYDQNVEEQDSSAIRAVVQYSVGSLQLGLLAEDYDDDVESKSAQIVSAKYTIDSWALKAQYGSSDIIEEGGQSASIGVDYKMAKSTKVFGYYTDYSADDIGLIPGSEYSAIGLGIEHNF